MREAFGGAFMIRLVLVFIVVYVAFMAVAVNYAKAFRVKNRVINILEQHQYNGNDNVTIDEVDRYLTEIAYIVADDNRKTQCENNRGTWTTRGVCIVPKCSDDNKDECYYKVTTYIVVQAPIIVDYITFAVNGETKTIVY